MNKIVKNTLILTAITVVAGLLLGVVYGVTKDPIAKAQEKAKQEAFRSVLSDAETFESDTEFDADAASALLKENGYTSDDISVGIREDGTVTGIEMLSISETAGLGMKAKEADFKDQFKDKNVIKFTYTKTGESGDDMIDAISGATITTNAVTNAVDSALVYFQNELGGGSNE